MLYARHASLSLTEEGQRLFERAQRILAEVDEAEAELRRGRAEPEGVLRVSAPHALGRPMSVRSAAILSGPLRRSRSTSFSPIGSWS